MGIAVDIGVLAWPFILGQSDYDLAGRNPQEFVFCLGPVRFSTRDSSNLIHGGRSLSDSILSDKEGEAAGRQGKRALSM